MGEANLKYVSCVLSETRHWAPDTGCAKVFVVISILCSTRVRPHKCHGTDQEEAGQEEKPEEQQEEEALQQKHGFAALLSLVFRPRHHRWQYQDLLSIYLCNGQQP